MINVRNTNVMVAVSNDSRPSRRVRSLGLSVAAAMLAGTALVPATAQTYNINVDNGGPLLVTDFTGAPLNNPATITNGQLTVDAGVDLSFGGVLNDSLGVFNLIKTGSSALTLTGANTYTGGTELQNGTLVAGINGAFGTGALSVTGASTLSSSGAGTTRTVANAIALDATTLTLTSQAAQTLILSGVISGDGVIRKGGAGTVVRLTGANTYSGGTVLTGGTLAAGNDAALGVAGVSVQGDATLSSFGVNRSLSNAIGIDGGVALSLTSATNQVLTLSGVISGNGQLRKGGANATIRLTGVNTYTGGTTLTGGRIEIGNASAFGTGAVTTQGPNASTIALVDPNTGLTLANAINLTGASLTVEAPAAGQTLTLSGAITGAASRTFTVGGAGTVLLTGNNAIAANVIVNSGVLGIGSGAALGGAGTLVLNNAASVAFNGADLTVARRINNTNFENVQATVDTQGFNATLSGIVQDNVNGTLGLTKVGAGILTLSNPAVDLANRNSLTGGALVNEGTLNIVTGALRGAVTVNNGGTLAGTGSVAIGATTINSGGTLSPGNALVADSVGTLTFANLTTAAGSTINFNLAAPAGPNDLVVVNGNLSLAGTLNLAGLPGFGLGTYTLFTHTGTLTNNLALGTTPVAGFTYNLLAGVNSLDLNVTLADLYWDGAGIANGTVDGGTGNWSDGVTNWTDVTGTLQVAYTNDVASRAFFQGTAGVVTLTDTAVFSELHFLTDGYVINPAVAQGFDSLAALINVAGGVTATINAAIGSDGGLTKNGNGTLNLGAENTYITGTFLNAGRINIGVNGALGADAVNMAAGTTLGSYGGQATVNNTFVLAGNVTFAADTLLRLNGAISGGGGFTKTGAADLSLGVANSFTGNVGVSAGTITLYNNAALGDAGNALNLSANTGLGLGAGVNIANAISLAGAAQVTQPMGGTSTLSGVISGNGPLTLAQTGTLVLSGTNSYTGGTTITGGTIGIGSNSAFGVDDVTISGVTTLVPQGAITTVRTLANNFAINAATTVNGTGGTAGPPYGFSGNVLELNGNLTGSGSLQVVGGAALALGGSNLLYSGNLILGDGVVTNGGRLRLASVDALGTGTITLNRVSVLSNFTGGTLTINNNILVDGNGFEFAAVNGATAADNIIINGNITGFGVGSFNKLGAITVTLNGANNYNQLYIDGGGVVAGTNSALGNGQVINTEFGGSATIAAGVDGLVLANSIYSLKALVLDTAAFTMTLNGNLNSDAAHAVTKNGAGTLILNGNNGFSGDLSVNAGTVVAGSNTALGGGAASFAANTTLRSGANVILANNISVAGGVTIDTPELLRLNGVISGSGGLTKTGSNGLMLAGNNSFTGGFAFNAGQINLLSSTGFGDAGNMVNVATGTFGVTLGNGLNVVNAFTLAGATGFAVGAGNTAELSGAIGGAGALDKTDTGTLILSGGNSHGGGTSAAGTLQLNNSNAAGTGEITLNAATLAAGANLTLLNGVTLNGNSTIATLGNNVDLQGMVSGTGGLSITTTAGAPFGGAVTLGNVNNNFLGAVTIGSNAILNVADDNRLGNGANSITVNEGLFNAQGTFAMNRAVTLGGTFGQFDVAGTDVLTIDGLISGSQLRKDGTGTLIVTNGINSFTGGTDIRNGTLLVSASNALGTGGIIVTAGTLGSNVAGTVTLGNTLNIAAAGNFIDVAPALGVLELNGVVSGTDGFTKTGDGILRLNGANSYSGTIQLTGGEIDLEGSIAGGINASNGTRVTGAGTAGGTTVIADGGILSPGNSPGTLNFVNLVLNNGSLLNFELAGLAGVPGIDADLIAVTTDLTLDGILNITGLPGFNVGVGNRTIITYGNLLADNVLTIATAAPDEVTYSIQAGPVGAGAGVVQLNVAFGGTYRWDGANVVPNNVIDGGAGTFNLVNTNFTNTAGNFNLAYGNNATDDLEFGGTAGGVDVASAINFDQMDFVTTGYALGGVGSLNANNSAINLGANNATISTAITGGALAKNGSGTLTLTGANSFTTLAMNEGTLVAGSNTALGTAAATFGAGTSLVAQGNRSLGNAVTLVGGITIDSASNELTLGGAIGGTGPVTVISSGGVAGVRDGTLSLNGTNSYTGGTIVTDTTIVIGADAALGNAAGALTLNNSELRSTATVDMSRDIALGGTAAPTFNTATGTTLTANGIVSGAQLLQKIGDGTLVLGNVGNSFGGGIDILAGTVAAATDGALGTGNIRFSAAGGTLEALGNFATAKTLTLDAAGTINTNANVVTLTGGIGGAGLLTKSGAGNLILSVNNSYTGGTALTAGTITFTTDTAFGTNSITTTGGTTLVAGLNDPSGVTLTLANAIALGAGTTTLDLQGSTIDATNTGGATTDGTTLTLGGVISGAGALAITDFGRVNLNGANSYAGGTNIANAIVYVGTDTALGTNTVNGNLMLIGNDSGALRTLANNFVLTGANAFSTENDITLTGQIGGTNGFLKTATGTLTLIAANNFSGTTDLFGGRITVANNMALGTSQLDVGSIGQSTTLAAGAGGLALANTISLGIASNLVVESGAGTFTLGGPIIGVGILTKEQAGTLVLNGASNYSGGTALNAGTIQVGTSTALGTGLLTMAGGTTLVSGAAALALNNAITTNGLGTIDTGAFAFTLNGLVNGAGSITKIGAGNLVLNGANGFTGGSSIDAGTVTVGNNTALGTNLVTMANDTTLANNANNLVVANNFTIGNITVASGGNSFTMGGTIGGAGMLTKTGSGNLVLNGANGYTGGTALTAGTITVGTSTSLGTNALTMANATTLAAGVDALTLANAITTLGVGTVDTGAFTFTLGGVVDGAGSVTKVGSGNLVLNGANSYAAGTNLNVGTITVGTSTALGGGLLTMADATTLAAGADALALANNITTLGAGTVNTGAFTLTLNGAIDGAGSIAKNGTGNLVLNGANSYAGGSSINAGTATAGNNTAFGTGLVTMANDTTLANNSDNLVVANNFNIGNVTVATGANTFTMGGTVNGAGLLTKTGTGNLVLNGGNGYTGGTALTAGTVTVGTSTALGTGQLTMTGGTFLVAGADALVLGNGVTTLGAGTVDTGAFTLTLNGVVDGAGSIVKIGAGNLVLNNANTYSGGSSINAGTVTVGNNSALGTGLVTMLNGTTLANNTNNLVVANNFTIGSVTVATGANNFRMDGAIDGTGPLTKTGTGTLVLTGTNTYGGGTNLTDGTLQIDDGNAIGSGTLTTTAGTTLIAGLAINTPTLTLANNIVLGAGGNTTINLLGSNYGVNVTTGALNTNGTPLVLTGVISGDGGITTNGFLANGGGSIAFNNSNSFTGGVNLGSVIAYIGADGALGTGAVNLNAFGAGIQNAALGTTRTLTNAVNVNDFQHSIGGAGNLVMTGAIGGASELFKVNTGTVSFNGAGSTFGGTLTANAGTVLVNGSFVNAAANFVVAGGATLGGTGTIAGSASLANGANLNPGTSPGTLTVGNLSLSALTNVNFELGAANTLGGVFNDRVIVTGNLVLDGLLNVTETVGGTFGLGIYNLFSYGTLTDNGLTLNGALPNALTGSIQHNTAARQINLVVAGPDSVVLNWDGADFTGQAPGAPLGQGGNGVWNTGNTNWTGEAPGEVNATWQPNAVGIFGGTAGTVDVASAFTFAGLAFQTNGYTLANAGGSLTTNAMLGSFISVDPALTATINATIAGTGVLMKQGAGTLVLGGTNTNSGGVNLTNGTLAVTSDAALGTGVLTFTGGTTLRTDANVTIANNMVLAGTSTIDTVANAPTLNGVLSGAGLLFKTGSGNLTLNGANSYTGGTTINAGSVTVGTSTALGAGAVTMADATSLIAGANGLNLANGITTQGVGTIDTGAFGFTLSGVIGGAGSITKIGTGNLTLTSANSYAAGTNLNAGSITVTNSLALGTGTLAMADATSLIAGANGLNLANAVTTAGVGTVDTGTNTLTLSGEVSGAGSITKTGAGNLILTGANLYSGGTALTAGTITVGSSTALGSGELTMSDATFLVAGADSLALANGITTQGVGTVDTGAFTFTLNGVVGGAGSITKIGAGNLVLNGANSYSGGSFINAGIVTVGNNTALGTALVTMANATTLANNTDNLNVANAFSIGNVTVATGANSFTMGGAISGGGMLNKTGSGNLVLNGANGYTGGTALTAGTITVGTSTALGTGQLTMSDATFLVAGADSLTLANGITTQGVGTVDTGAFTFTLNGVVGGAGSVTKVGAGNLVLNGANSFGGGSFINAGTVTVGSNTALGTALVTMANDTTLANNTDNLNVANAFNIGNVTVATGANSFTMSGTIGGAGLLTKTGSGNLILTGSNGYTGGTALTAGTITIGANTALGTGQLTMSDATTLVAGANGLTVANGITTLGVGTVDTGANTLTLGGVIDGAGSITKIGAGNLVLNGANSFGGGSFINVGTVTVGSNTALGSGLVTMANDTTLANNTDNLVIANAFNIGNVTVATGANNFTMGGTIGGAGLLTKTGTGNLILNGANGYTGGTALTAGTITVGTSTALGTGSLTAADATSLVAGVSGLSVANLVTLNGGLTVDSSTGSFQLSGVIDGAGSITKVNSGNLILSGANSYTGGTNLNAGSLTITNNASIGTGTLTTTGGTTVFAGLNDPSASLALTLGNAVVLGAGLTNIDLQGSTILAAEDGAVTVDGTTLTLNGLVSGAGGLNVTDYGRLTLNGANSYAGGTNVTNTALYVGNDSALGTGTLTMSGSVLANDSGALRTLANNVALALNSVVAGPNDITLNGVVSGTGSLAKTSMSTLTLNGVNTYSNNSLLFGGRITVGTDSAMGTGALIVSATPGQTTTLAAGVTGLALANNATLNAGSNLIVESGAGIFTLNGVIGGVGALTKIQSGTLILNGANSFAGGTALNVGTIQVGTNTALGTGGLVMADATTLQSGAADLALANAITTNGLGTIDTQAFTFTLNGVIGGAGSISKIGAGNLVLNGTNSFGGGSFINAGTVTVGSNTALGSGLVTMANDTTLANNTNNLNVANAFSIGNVTVATGANNFTMSGTIGGAGLLTKTGSGNLILTGSNGYTGGTALTAGTITVGTSTALGIGQLTMSDATFLVAGADSLALANGITTLGVGTVDTGAFTFTLNGVVDGAGSITKIGAGNLVLNGANSFGGGSFINVGTVTVGSNTALGSGLVTMANDTTLANNTDNLVIANAFNIGNVTVATGANNFTMGGTIGGAGLLTKTGTGNLILNGANGYTGGTALTAGTITVGTSTALGTGQLTMSDATFLVAGADSLALANGITTLGVGTVDTGAFTFTLNGVVDGAGSITKIGAGTLILNSANLYAGGTTLNVGTIQVGTSTALGTGGLVMAGGTTLQAGAADLALANAITTNGVGTIDTQAFTFTLNGVIDGAGSITKIGTGNLVLNGANSFSGGSSLVAGTVTIGNNTALGTGTVSIDGAVTLLSGINNLAIANNVVLNNGVTLDTAAFTTSYTGVISGAAGITKVGSGNLILSGVNSYAGGTNLNAGSLTVTNNSSIGTGALNTTGGTTLIVGTATGVNTAITLANAVTLGAGTTTVNLQGTALAFNNDGSIVTDGASLTLNGVVSGAGALATGTFGSLTLNGANSYTGGTLINTRSVVYVGSDTAVGTGTVTMGAATGLYNNSGATRTLANSFVLNGGSWLGGTNDLVLNGGITGTGTLIKAGAQTLVLNGDNSGFTGNSQLRDGRITVSSNTALGTGGTLTVFAPVAAPAAGLATTLTAGTDGLTLVNNLVLSTGSNLIVESGAGTFTLGGVFSGAGALTKINAGTLVLNGANSFAGGTALNVGTIQVGTGTALGTGGLVMAGGTTLQSGAADLALANAITTNGLGTIDTQAFSFTLNGVVDGAGSITKIGTGNLVLNAANSFSGGSFINAGTVTVGSNTALGTGLAVMLDGTTLTTNTDGLALANEFNIGNVTVATEGFTLTLNGPIGGGGLLTKTGTGNLVLNGSNAYGGGTALTAGTITIGANTALGTGQLTMSDVTTLVAGVDALVVANGITTLGVGTVDTGANTLTLTGVIDGVGSITKTSGGNLILQGLNTYAGGTLLDAGTITVATDTAIGTGLLTMAGGTTLNSAVNVAAVANTQNVTLANAITGAGIATFNVNTDLSLTLNGVVSGTGQWNKTGAGLLVLNGANSFSGGFALNGGTVQTGSNTALGIGAVVTAGGTTLQNGANGITLANNIAVGGPLTIDTQAFAYTLNGVISGSGPITKIGAANLTLNGANSYTGGTGLNAGSITVGANTALGTGALTMAGGTSLIAGASNLTLANAIVTLGVGTVDTGANTLTLGGVISGDGSIAKIGTGNLIVTGTNSYAGGTALNVGTITVGNNSALGTGTLAMAGGTTLNTAGNITLANAITTAGIGTFNTNAGLMLTLNGILSGAGNVTKTGSGILVLNGANSYSGGTALNEGTIRVGSNTALGTGDVAAAAGTTLQAGGTVNLANNFAMAGGMTVDNFGNLLTLGGVLSGTGPLSVIDSTGSALGVLTLAGVNSYTGGTVVTGTTVSVSQNANLGNVAGGVTLIGGTLRTTASFATDRGIVLGAGGGTLAVATDTVFTVNGVISGTRLTKNSGELVLTAANTYTGGTALNAGTITVANNQALGTGALDMAGGTTLNTATNLGTTPNTPMVTLANAITTAGVGTINTNTGLTLVANGVVSGDGSINKTGAGLLVLNGANSYTGGTTLAGGTIRTGTGSALGTGRLTTTGGTTLQAGNAGLTVANAITLGNGITTVDTQAFTYTLSGVASGTGGMSKIGSGVLNLTGASTYTGATTVAAGTLNVTGSLVSAVTVNSGAAITGTGTVGALNVLAGASVNPATNGTTNTATLTVTGAATLAGTYTVNVTPSANDRITAGGALTLGGTLVVVPAPVPVIFSQFNQTFTIASGSSRTGTFATVTGLDQFGIAFAPVVDYTATLANIRLAPQSLVVLGNRFGGISGNQLEVAQAFDRAVANGYNPQAFFNVYANGGTALPATLRQMSGEQRATERRVVLDTNRVFRESALDRLNGGLASLGGQQVSSSDGDRTLTYWLRGAGSWGKAQTSGAATAFTTEQRGIITGLDWAKGGLTFGAMFHYTSTDVEYRVLGGTSNVETVGGTAYAGYRQDGGLVLNGGVSVAGARTSGARAITLPSFAQTLTGVTRGTTYQFFGEVGWDLAASANTRIEPFARFTYVRADMGALAETGGVAALSAAKQNYDLAVTNVGARFGANVADGKVALNASVSYQHMGDDRDAATIIGIPAVGQNGLIRSVQMDRDSLSLQADAGVNLSSTIRFSLGYSGLIGKRNDDHGGRATLNFAF